MKVWNITLCMYYDRYIYLLCHILTSMKQFFELIVHGFNGEAKIEKACHSERNVGFIKFLPNPSYCQQLHLHRSAVKMTSVSETTRTLRCELRSREINIEEPITSPEILSEHPRRRMKALTPSSRRQTANSGWSSR